MPHQLSPSLKAPSPTMASHISLTVQRIITLIAAVFLARFFVTSVNLSEIPHRFRRTLPASDTAPPYVARIRDLPTCVTARPARTFLIVFSGHSGSSAICTELRNHPAVHMTQLELVDHQDQYNTTLALQQTRAFFEEGIAKNLVPGFKIRPAHILDAPQQWASLAREYDTRIVWQYRRNILKASVAKYLAMHENYSYRAGGMREPDDNKECVAGPDCRYQIRRFDVLHGVLKASVRTQRSITRAVQAIDGGRGCVFELPYEDYLYSRVQTMLQLERFIGLPLQITEPERYKTANDRLCEMVRNWDELCQHFYGCITWQHMLEDAYNGCFCRRFTGGIDKFCSLV